MSQDVSGLKPYHGEERTRTPWMLVNMRKNKHILLDTLLPKNYNNYNGICPFTPSIYFCYSPFSMSFRGVISPKTYNYAFIADLRWNGAFLTKLRICRKKLRICRKKLRICRKIFRCLWMFFETFFLTLRHGVQPWCRDGILQRPAWCHYIIYIRCRTGTWKTILFLFILLTKT